MFTNEYGGMPPNNALKTEVPKVSRLLLVHKRRHFRRAA